MIAIGRVSKSSLRTWPRSLDVSAAATITRRTWMAATVLLVAASQTPFAAAHPFHATLGEVEFNSPRNRLEVALKIHSYDLEQAVKRHDGTPLDLDHSANADVRLRNYLVHAFRVRAGDPTPCRIHWVGKEVTPQGRMAVLRS